MRKFRIVYNGLKQDRKGETPEKKKKCLRNKTVKTDSGDSSSPQWKRETRSCNIQRLVSQ